MTPRQVEVIRARAQHAISPHTAQYGRMSHEELKAFCCNGSFYPDDLQLQDLARYFNLKEPAQ